MKFIENTTEISSLAAACSLQQPAAACSAACSSSLQPAGAWLSSLEQQPAQQPAQ